MIGDTIHEPVTLTRGVFSAETRPIRDDEGGMMFDAAPRLDAMPPPVAKRMADRSARGGNLSRTGLPSRRVVSHPASGS